MDQSKQNACSHCQPVSMLWLKECVNPRKKLFQNLILSYLSLTTNENEQISQKRVTKENIFNDLWIET